MSAVGTKANFVDTQDVELRNVTDALIYRQVFNLYYDIDHAMDINYLRDSQVEKLFDLSNIAVEGDMLVTQPEIAALITLSTPVLDQLPRRQWRVTVTDQSNNSTQFNLSNAVLRSFRMVDPGAGLANWHFRIEGDGTV